MKICVHPAGTGGVAFYRVQQPYLYLKSIGVDVYIFDKDRDDYARLHQEQMSADVIVYQCPWSEGIYEAAK